MSLKKPISFFAAVAVSIATALSVQPAFATDTTPPALASAKYDSSGSTITLTFDETLDSQSSPQNADFQVNVNSSPVTVNSLLIGNALVVLSLGGGAIAVGDTVDLSYTAGTPGIQDISGNPAVSFSQVSVLPPNSSPVFSTGTTAPNVTAGVGGLVYSNSATDADTSDTLTYSIDSAASTAGFTVNSATGAVSASTSVVAGTYSITLTVTDGTATVNDTAVSITVAAAQVVTPPAPSNTVAGAPTGVTATAGNATATVSWTAPTSNGGAAITDYAIEYSSDSGATWSAFAHTASTATSATVTGLVNGKTYVFRIKAVNSVGQSAAASSSSVTPTAPVVEPVQKSTSDRTTFSGNSTALSAKQKAGLRAYFALYNGNKNLTIQVVGYAVSKSSTKTSIAAATARAKAVAAFIKTLGIDATVTTKIVSKGTKAQAVFNLNWVE
jgi:outer membrane protein OmpA-like peptidoglycan-associated protein